MPEQVHIQAGGSVTWQNYDAVAHRVVVTVGEKVAHHELPPHGKVTVVFPEEGSLTYHCLPHPFMTGTAEVGERQVP